MEDGQDPYSHEEEARGLNISAGDEDMESNRHIGRIGPLEMMKIMRRLNMEAQI
jgi:hypothetical protein